MVQFYRAVNVQKIERMFFLNIINCHYLTRNFEEQDTVHDSLVRRRVLKNNAETQNFAQRDCTDIECQQSTQEIFESGIILHTRLCLYMNSINFPNFQKKYRK